MADTSQNAAFLQDPSFHKLVLVKELNIYQIIKVKGTYQ